MTALASVLPTLRCPVCAVSLALVERQVRCEHGHSFDLARQGYVNLAVGAHAGTGDDAAMVTARDAVLAGTLLRPLRDAVVAALPTTLPPGVVVDLAGGTGVYSAAVLDALPDRSGLDLDLSAPALRRAARAHPRLAAVGADVWRPLPLRDDAAAVALSIFGPRDADEVRRVLAPGGALVVASPRADHLREVVGPLGLIGVDPRKAERQETAFVRFESIALETVSSSARLTPAEVVAVIAMGPSAVHLRADEITRRVATLPDPLEVTVAVDVRTYRPSD